mmetsp:Transcript_94/g.397  ORF Transcript_94/g.397 Transcript_94/m.397 type:complete len:396 (+) Transcript_94:88-1275(+)
MRTLVPSKVAGQDQLESMESSSSEDEDLDVRPDDRLWPKPCLCYIGPIFSGRRAHRCIMVLNLAFVVEALTIGILLPAWYVDSWSIIKVSGELPRILAIMASAIFIPVLFTLHYSEELSRDPDLENMLRELHKQQTHGPDFENAFRRSFKVQSSVLLFGNIFLVAMVTWYLPGWLGIKFWGLVILPFSVVGLELFICSLVLLGVMRGCLAEIEKFIARLSMPAEDKKSGNEGFWTYMIREHQKMDDTLERVCHASACTLGAFVATWFVFVFGTFIIFFATKDQTIKVIILVTVGTLFLMVQVYVFKGPADITELCWTKSMHGQSVLKAAAKHFGREDFTTQVRQEHQNFMAYLSWIDCGFEVPFVGVISMSRLLHYAKLTLGIVPVAIGYVLKAD